MITDRREIMEENEELTPNKDTGLDNYKITPAETRLLEVLLDPANTGKNITEKCELAEISREYYYRIMKKPDFVSLLNKTAIDLVKEKISDILSASIKVATGSGARGYQDRRMLLEMAGLISKDEPTGNVILIRISD
jgi:hypothetical protein